jgi:hypothetical protein
MLLLLLLLLWLATESSPTANHHLQRSRSPRQHIARH